MYVNDEHLKAHSIYVKQPGSLRTVYKSHPVVKFLLSVCLLCFVNICPVQSVPVRSSSYC